MAAPWARLDPPQVREKNYRWQRLPFSHRVCLPLGTTASASPGERSPDVSEHSNKSGIDPGFLYYNTEANDFEEVDTMKWITLQKMVRDQFPSVSKELKFADKFAIDSFVTHQQELMAVGIRTSLRSRQNGPSQDWSYFVEQGIMSQLADVLPTPPYICEGTCGTLLVRVIQEGKATQTGDVFGFMLWNDVKGYSSNLYCFCQTADELLDDGLEIVCQDKVQKKREFEDMLVDNFQNSFSNTI
jgi:hypothetical protein